MSRYITFYESKSITTKKGTISVDSKEQVTVRIESIVSIHEKRIEYSPNHHCIVTMANNFRYHVTPETAETIKKLLDATPIPTNSQQG